MIGTRGEEFGVGAFSGKQRPAHIRDKKMELARRGYERVFICLSRWKFTISLCSFHLSSLFPPPSASSLLPLCLSFLITLSHGAPLPPPSPPLRKKNIPLTCGIEGFTWAQTHRYKHTPHNPTNRPGSLVVSVSMPPLPLIVFFFFFFLHVPCPRAPTLLSLPHLLSSLSFLVWLYCSRLRFFPTCSAALWLPSPRPGLDIKGSMSISLPSPSEVHTCTHLHTPTPTHTHTHTHTKRSQTHKCARTLKSTISGGRKWLIWEVDRVSADASSRTLTALAKWGKGLTLTEGRYTYVYTHSRRCVFFTFSKQWQRRPPVVNKGRFVWSVCVCVCVCAHVYLCVCVLFAVCGLVRAARVWIIISMCQNFVGMRLVMHSDLTAITHRLSFSFSFPSLTLSAKQRQIAVTNT